jgi:hypothetical protein
MNLKELENRFEAASRTAGHSKNTRQSYLRTIKDFAVMVRVPLHVVHLPVPGRRFA